MPTRVPLSVLDLAILGEGQSSADALRATTLTAQRAEALGYRRFWVAEHHNMPAVASTSPPVLIAHLAAATSTMRVGSGGVMLPNHAPLVVAEQFAMLEALHPGRIDLGLGRAPGTDRATAAALRRSTDALGVEEFPQHVTDLLALFGDRRSSDGHALADRFAATPVALSSPAVLLLGSSGYSAQLAGLLGLPFAFAHHFGGGGTREALALYRDTFRPSPNVQRPYAIVTASVLVADTAERARFLAGPGQLMVLGVRSGQIRPLHTAEEAARHPQRDLAAELARDQVIGDPDTVVATLDRLLADTGADELMVTAATYGLEERLDSLELLARAWPGEAPEAA